MAVDLIPSVNSSELITSFWKEGFPVLIDKAGPLIGILQTAGIVLIIYWIFLIVRGVLNMKDRRRLKRVEAKLDLILERLPSKKQKNKK